MCGSSINTLNFDVWYNLDQSVYNEIKNGTEHWLHIQTQSYHIDDVTSSYSGPEVLVGDDIYYCLTAAKVACIKYKARLAVDRTYDGTSYKEYYYFDESSYDGPDGWGYHGGYQTQEQALNELKLRLEHEGYTQDSSNHLKFTKSSPAGKSIPVTATVDSSYTVQLPAIVSLARWYGKEAIIGHGSADTIYVDGKIPLNKCVMLTMGNNGTVELTGASSGEKMYYHNEFAPVRYYHPETLEFTDGTSTRHNTWEMDVLGGYDEHFDEWETSKTQAAFGSFVLTGNQMAILLSHGYSELTALGLSHLSFIYMGTPSEGQVLKGHNDKTDQTFVTAKAGGEPDKDHLEDNIGSGVRLYSYLYLDMTKAEVLELADKWYDSEFIAAWLEDQETNKYPRYGYDTFDEYLDGEFGITDKSNVTSEDVWCAINNGGEALENSGPYKFVNYAKLGELVPADTYTGVLTVNFGIETNPYWAYKQSLNP